MKTFFLATAAVIVTGAAEAQSLSNANVPVQNVTLESLGNRGAVNTVNGVTVGGAGAISGAGTLTGTFAVGNQTLGGQSAGKTETTASAVGIGNVTAGSGPLSVNVGGLTNTSSTSLSGSAVNGIGSAYNLTGGGAVAIGGGAAAIGGAAQR